MKQNVIFILIDGCRADKIFDKDSTAKTNKKAAAVAAIVFLFAIETSGTLE